MDLKDYVSHEPFHLQSMGAITTCSPSPISLPLLSPSQSQSQSPFPSSCHPDPALQSSSLNHVMNNFYPEPVALSLHNYRKYLAHGGSSTSVDGHDFKKLRRKNAALNLNQPSDPPHSVSPFSVSSASSPPPLSPSSSPSAVSELGAESLRGFLLSPSPVDWGSGERSGHRLDSYKILNTFRDRLEQYPDPDPTPSIRGHSKTYSDSALLNVPQDDSTVISHNGTSFEILNPHESLRFARIVSYIEDVDTYSVPSSSGHGHQRDSYLFDDTNSIPIYDTSFLDDDDHRSFPYPLEDTHEEDISPDVTAHHDLVGDSPHHPMPSISERLEENDVESTYSPDDPRRNSYSFPYPPSPTSPSHSRSYSYSHFHRPSRLWTPRSFDSSDLGEPGSPVCEDDYNPHTSWKPSPGYPRSLDAEVVITRSGKNEIHVQRRPTQRSSNRPAKGGPEASKTGPFRRLCVFAMAWRRKKFFGGEGTK
ncbi:hypothetical protein P170DRAFT_137281 [Aspergillus steynii IBT 23096]|uniref:Uncharacterized protein n=1 Tax=Aspergillus steynii IBT 23096 TaxID=1392250 RepID=A0A2I2GBA0_9EURO|nr:uncharacterized protein P170DRAFT_137281 [Aspergillus steynii IBT 23096]PLB50156.1 hypothetical protein P170DRAFT_137281 [Aspergillus steynii IBT 23096]